MKYTEGRGAPAAEDSLTEHVNIVAGMNSARMIDTPMFSEYQEEKKPPVHNDVKRLNRIALLLVTRKEHDKAAVGLSIHGKFGEPTCYELLYAKDEPCTEKESHYVQDLAAVLNDQSLSRDKLLQRLRSLTYDACHEKLHKRMNGIATTFQHYKKIMHDGKKEIPEPEPRRLGYLRGLTPFWDDESKTPFLTFMEGYCESLVQATPGQSEYATFKSIVIARLLRFKGLRRFYVRTRLQRKLEKLADYFWAWEILVAESMRYRSGCRFVATEIIQPPVSTVMLERSTLDFVNAFGKNRVYEFEEFAVEDLGSSFSTYRGAVKVDLSQPMGVVRKVVHCEVAIGMELFQRASTKVEQIDIGGSKSLCRFCAVYLIRLSMATKKRIRVNKAHGEVFAEWTLPPCNDATLASTLETNMLSEARAMLEEKIEDLNERRLEEIDFEDLEERRLEEMYFENLYLLERPFPYKRPDF